MLANGPQASKDHLPPAFPITRGPAAPMATGLRVHRPAPGLWAVPVAFSPPSARLHPGLLPVAAQTQLSHRTLPSFSMPTPPSPLGGTDHHWHQHSEEQTVGFPGQEPRCPSARMAHSRCPLDICCQYTKNIIIGKGLEIKSGKHFVFLVNASCQVSFSVLQIHFHWLPCVNGAGPLDWRPFGSWHKAQPRPWRLVARHCRHRLPGPGLFLPVGSSAERRQLPLAPHRVSLVVERLCGDPSPGRAPARPSRGWVSRTFWRADFHPCLEGKFLGGSTSTAPQYLLPMSGCSCLGPGVVAAPVSALCTFSESFFLWTSLPLLSLTARYSSSFFAVSSPMNCCGDSVSGSDSDGCTVSEEDAVLLMLME